MNVLVSFGCCRCATTFGSVPTLQLNALGWMGYRNCFTVHIETSSSPVADLFQIRAPVLRLCVLTKLLTCNHSNDAHVEK